LRSLVAASIALLLSAPTPVEERGRDGKVVAEQLAPRTRVVMLHGLGRSERAMQRLARRFQERGYSAVPIGYDSTSQTLDEIVDEIEAHLADCCDAAERLHFVTHSLGGIVLRAWAAQEAPDRIGRVVMLSPPNHGSVLVDRLGGLSALLGPTGRELGTAPDSAPNRLNALGPVEFELGVIAGNRSWNPLGSWLLDGPDDGTVSVESAKVPGMRDFLIVPASHSFMMYDREVARQAIYFVEHGRFDGGALPDAAP
jgi:pimeloyl-ACP methyl ester carboxylesterase